MSCSVDAPRGAVRLLTRVIVVPLLVVLVAGAFVVTTKALAVRDAGTGTGTTETSRPAGEQPWKDSYARRFPGCVPAVLWPARETPAAVVVQWDGRKVERVERGRALRGALSVDDTGTGRIIGACYR